MNVSRRGELDEKVPKVCRQSCRLFRRWSSGRSVHRNFGEQLVSPFDPAGVRAAELGVCPGLEYFVSTDGGFPVFRLEQRRAKNKKACPDGICVPAGSEHDLVGGFFRPAFAGRRLSCDSHPDCGDPVQYLSVRPDFAQKCVVVAALSVLGGLCQLFELRVLDFEPVILRFGVEALRVRFDLGQRRTRKDQVS